MSLYHKYRPQTFEEVIGNKAIVESLQSCLNSQDNPHSLLLYGSTGCGKTTLGRIVASELGCKGNDLREIDSADFRGIDTIREIRKQAQFRPLEGSCKVWILDECHKLSNDAMNALLKALEDTPPHVYYILCTTDPQKLISTIKGRCSQYQVDPLNEKDMKRLLRKVVKGENDKLEKQVYEQITQDSQGHPRDALQILDQVLGVDPEQRLEIAKKSAETQNQSIELCRALMQGAGWKKVSNILQGLKDQEPETIRRQVLGYCSSILLKEENDRTAAIMEEMLTPFFHTGMPGLVFACYSIVKGE